jgi:hypothetical protein
VFAREFGFTPQESRDLPFYDRWALLDGLNKTYASDDAEAAEEQPRPGELGTQTKPASLQDLAGLGIQAKKVTGG